MFPKVNPSHTTAWNSLQKLKQEWQQNHSLANEFQQDDQRTNHFFIDAPGIGIDFSKNYLSQAIFDQLIQLAKECHLESAIQALFRGDVVNETEKRAVLHTALRDFSGDHLTVNNQEVSTIIREERAKVESFVNSIHEQKRLGFSGKPFKYVVNIGIGGSDLGPAMAAEALRTYGSESIKVFFVNNVDNDNWEEVLSKIKLEETLFIVVSKTFTTQETLMNANLAKTEIINHYKDAESVNAHFVGVTMNKSNAIDFGVSPDEVFLMWDWVCGRFSVWSSVGLSLALFIGYDNYLSFLKGAEEMDRHFQTTSLEKNTPVLMALVSIWYSNFWNTTSEAVIPYAHALRKFVPFLQQAAMESNGKSVDRSGNPIDYTTCPIIWGDVGTNAQHSFFQLLHQGTQIVPVEFIQFAGSSYSENKKILRLNGIAQSEALMKGKSLEEVKKQANDDITHLQHKVFQGNRPSTTILVDDLSPKSLGRLMALYEHKITVQGVIWNVFSFDQWGVELGKELAKKLNQQQKDEAFSSSTRTLLKKLIKK